MRPARKVFSYLIATISMVIISQSYVFAGGKIDNGYLSVSQIVGGIAFLVAVIMMPVLRHTRRVNLRK